MARSQRLGYVDGLRGVAVLAVVAHHAIGYWRPHAPWLLHAGDLGAHGVDLFFVVSGLCLALPYLRATHAGGALAFDPVAYAWKRATRIGPAYYVAIAILAVAALAGAGSRAAAAPGALASQLAFAGGGPLLAAPFWTLPIEARWYVEFPLALWLFSRSRAAFAAVAIGGGALYYALPHPVADLGYLPEFCGGILAADLALAPGRFARYAAPVAALFGAIVVVAEPSPGRGFVALEPALVLAAVSAVIAAGRVAPVRRVLEMRVLRETGVASYAIYLVHDPVLAGLHALGAAWWFAVPVALAAGVPLYLGVERPVFAAARAAMRGRYGRAITRAASG